MQDVLDWNDARHARAQGELGNTLVHQFMIRHFPVAKADTWQQVSGAVFETMASIRELEGEPKNHPRLIAIMDFNVPNARDVTKLKEVALAIATIFKSHGANHCVFLAHMAAYCKEDTCEDPIDDEHAIYLAFQKVGVGAQQRVRCLLSQPGGYENSAKTGDWFADSRLMYLAPNDVAARGALLT